VSCWYSSTICETPAAPIGYPLALRPPEVLTAVLPAVEAGGPVEEGLPAVLVQSQVLQGHHAGDGEIVVDLGDVDVLGAVIPAVL
jgi:hypothetical protein